jgi:hypothetical protein
MYVEIPKTKDSAGAAVDWVLPKNTKIVVLVHNLDGSSTSADSESKINVFCFVCMTVDCTYETAIKGNDIGVVYFNEKASFVLEQQPNPLYDLITLNTIGPIFSTHSKSIMT